MRVEKRGIQMQEIYASSEEDGKTRTENVFAASNPTSRMSKEKEEELGKKEAARKDVWKKVTQEGWVEEHYYNTVTRETAR